jgi:enoyl-[acyl-carrier-protein] reductase (NADH)
MTASVRDMLSKRIFAQSYKAWAVAKLSDVAAAIYLVSEASDFVTGQTLFVDGGFKI